MVTGILALTTLGLGLGAGLAVAARRLAVEGDPLAEEIAALMPGVQCGQCGFASCSQAAEAIAAGDAKVTVCPPGGRALATQLADKLGVEVALDEVEEPEPQVAFINEDLCVGCGRCFKRCPTDAVIGAPHQIHVVIADACTGCGKCVEACPTEGAELRPVPPKLQTWVWPKPDLDRCVGHA